MFLLKFPLKGWEFLAESAKTAQCWEFFSDKAVAIRLLKISEEFSTDKYRHFGLPFGENKIKPVASVRYEEEE